LSVIPAVEPHVAASAALVLFFAYLVRGIAGFGSGLIAVPLLSLLFPVPSVIPLVVSLDYVGSLSQGVKNLDRVAWREQLALVPFTVAGVALGLFALQTVPSAVLAKTLGAFVMRAGCGSIRRVSAGGLVTARPVRSLSRGQCRCGRRAPNARAGGSRVPHAPCSRARGRPASVGSGSTPLDARGASPSPWRPRCHPRLAAPTRA
jgi:Sulfite exporter TauE/SafE